MANPWAAIQPIFEQHGTAASVEEFQQQVNVHFHAVEAGVYDNVHREMWESLPVQFQLLSEDALSTGDPGQNLRLLDIGSGTGLSTDLLLKTQLGKRISEVCLLDTSPEMLDLALKRSREWGRKVEGKIGFVSDLPLETFDVVLTCSVLHHIPILPDFLGAISQRQKNGGLLLHLQDPNKDHLADPEYVERAAKLRRIQEAQLPSKAAKAFRRWNPVRLARRIVSGPDFDYIAAVNQSLMDAGVLRSPLTAEQIWTITDVHDAPDQTSGISLTEMQGWLTSYDLVSMRSYGFFGKLVSRLPKDLATEEIALRDRKAPNGYFLSASWRKNDS